MTDEQPKRYTPDGQEVPPPSDNDVLYEPDDGFAWVTLNRPLVLNAVDWSLRRGMGRALDQAEADDDVRAIILRGAGRAFCAGGDLQGSDEPDDGVETPSAMDLMMRLWMSPKPVIAAVRGHAVGQGCEWAGVCDMTIAADDIKIGEIQIRHGFGPPILITPFLANLKNAKELLASLGAEWEEIDLVEQPERTQEMLDRSGGRTTVPEIFIDDELIGGFDDLVALHRKGELVSKLAE